MYCEQGDACSVSKASKLKQVEHEMCKSLPAKKVYRDGARFSQNSGENSGDSELSKLHDVVVKLFIWCLFLQEWRLP